MLALTSIICATYLWVWLIKHDASGYYSLKNMLKLLEYGVPDYWDFNRNASGTLLSILSAGLIVSFTFLVHSIRKYYKGQMVVEMRWLSILFAIFSICYGFRTIYQFLLGNFHNYVPNMYVRWQGVALLPIVFDIIPICAILIMHHMNFRNKRTESRQHPYFGNRTESEISIDNDCNLEPQEAYLEYKKNKESTLNSDIADFPPHNLMADSNEKWLTTKVSRNTNDEVTEKFDLDTSILSEI